MNIQKKILLITHLSPPLHGAAVVGDKVKDAISLKEGLNSKFVRLGSSETIANIGGKGLKKYTASLKIIVNIIIQIFIFRPHIVYLTPSLSGAGFLRDLIIVSLLKLYRYLFNCDYFLHIHMRPTIIEQKNKILNNSFSYFFTNSNVILLEESLKLDFGSFLDKANLYFLPNGIRGINIPNISRAIASRLNNSNKNILYVGHMLESKGYKRVLNLALESKYCTGYCFYFAGEWGSSDEQDYFYAFVNKHELGEKVKYLGVVKGEAKVSAFEMANALILPSYSEAFPLTIIEALSAGLPVIATNTGAIKSMVGDDCGVVVDDVSQLKEKVIDFFDYKYTKELMLRCRKKYLDNYTEEKFLRVY